MENIHAGHPVANMFPCSLRKEEKLDMCERMKRDKQPKRSVAQHFKKEYDKY